MVASTEKQKESRKTKVADWFFNKLWIWESRRNDAKVDMYRKMLWPEISGKVLDLGPGFAKSLEFLCHATASDSSYAVDPAVIHSYTALEPNPFLYDKLHKNAEQNGFCVSYDRQTFPEGLGLESTKDGMIPFNIVRGTLDDASKIPQAVLDGAPYDTVLTSFSMCTVKDPESTVRNIVSLLKPGGKYVFIEHVLQPDIGDPHVVEENNVNARFWARVQRFINPLWKKIGHGCNINRRTGNIIASASGWESVDYRSIRPVIDLQSRIMPLSFGIATKAKGQ
ncbi:hypothetical protein IW140_001603 [Coemansia sp. RSA 1813]|nr:hypothetical protein EV178_001636 [Coemansia sp. RSA 1646]KAJ1773442.1 hypothetical protein LPJ74_000695 [Coemansia sp. RSA 1843]KAJ2091303.1 hypothetical protein IW138_002002 [Coemansia sp. RSA 986]KAJ2216494.1 hypothetical protein EV179_001289 [Coemansia sp. RSA 487]KAJ2571423.1 hypothetical protein IW140_001603 [Coemansia sp. RSA 1813]